MGEVLFFVFGLTAIGGPVLYFLWLLDQDDKKREKERREAGAKGKNLPPL
ncbi:hypothetical protein [Helicobacter heilmannii]|uniref:Uncharacterized protein n=1 Tax=Helicobacter heilmannii TaxID=35817 RepID=A0A0K2Y8P6_HELHE|nr:hypothetical protein [Helicobacter heilmannii]GMB94356.1 hypothetical protein NHP21011_04480 [Helicobacter heilmannii]CCM12338.1 hypothetical protein BN341_8210 [Helicobacter heilmannii ASB1.4]CRI34517.1 hypothetical protein HHE01_13630 [Helicobacter heilmannii]